MLDFAGRAWKRTWKCISLEAITVMHTNMRLVRFRHFPLKTIGASMVAEWWFDSTCERSPAKRYSPFLYLFLDDTRKFGSVPIMELEPVAIRSGVYSPCRFESYTLRSTGKRALICGGIGKH